MLQSIAQRENAERTDQLGARRGADRRQVFLRRAAAILAGDDRSRLQGRASDDERHLVAGADERRDERPRIDRDEDRSFIGLGQREGRRRSLQVLP